jgi:hypothetical protein
MSMNNPRAGIGSVPEYQISGVPWAVSGSVSTTPVIHEFPMVASAVTVANNSAAGSFLLIGFTANGTVVGSSSFPLNGGQQIRMEVRVRDLWLKGQNGTVNYGVISELTSIERRQMPYLTSSASPSSLVASASWVYPGVG